MSTLYDCQIAYDYRAPPEESAEERRADAVYEIAKEMFAEFQKPGDYRIRIWPDVVNLSELAREYAQENECDMAEAIDAIIEEYKEEILDNCYGGAGRIA